MKVTKVVIDISFFRSYAYGKISSNAKILIIELYTRRKMAKYNLGKTKGWAIANNGQIELTYIEIHKRYGFSNATISKAFRELEKWGFIKIENHNRGGLFRAKNKYTLINDYLKFNERLNPKSTPKIDSM